MTQDILNPGQQTSAAGDDLPPTVKQEGEDAACRGTGRRRAVLLAAVLAVSMLLGFGIYSNVLSRGIFIFDDFEYVVDNPIVKDISLITKVNDPRQLGYLSFALNYAADPEWNPFSFHLVNILIHVFAAVMLYFLLRVLRQLLAFGPAGRGCAADGHEAPQEDYVSGLAALIFLVHPLQTQAVSYVTQRFTSLSTFFYVAAILSYLVARMRLERDGKDRGADALYWMSLAATACAMKTKEIAFTIPFMMAAFELLVFKGSSFGGRRFYFVIPCLATLLIIPLSLLGPDWGLTDPGIGVDEVTRRDKLFDLFQRSPFEYLATQLRVIVTYIRLMILPVNQLVVYNFRASATFFEVPVILSFLFLLALAGAAVIAWRRAGKAAPADAVALRTFSLGMLWFFMTLSIESSVIPIKDVIFEHRMYLPGIGFFAAVCALLELLSRRLFAAVPLRRRMAVLAVLIIVPLSAATYLRNEIWTDEVRFWDDVVRKTGKAIGYNNRGNAYLKLGKYDLAVRDLDATVAFFSRGREVMKWENADFTPVNMSKTYMSRGSAYAALGDMERANADFAMARQVLFPGRPPGSDRP